MMMMMTLNLVVVSLRWRPVILPVILTFAALPVPGDAIASSPVPASSEIHQVRGLSGATGSKVELPCLVDQVNCGEVYYITWTRQQSVMNNAHSGGATSTNSTQQSLLMPSPSVATLSSPTTTPVQLAHTHWSRVYLYTGANDSSPHKPIGDLVNRATFVMPQDESNSSGLDSTSSEQTGAGAGAGAGIPAPSGTGTGTGLAAASGGAPGKPLARLIIEEPRLSDEALYKCDVTYVRGKCPSISLVKLDILTLPKKAQIYQLISAPTPSSLIATGTGTLRRHLVPEGQALGPMEEGDQLRLVCSITGARPAPKSVIWRKIDPSGRLINLPAASYVTKFGGALVELELNHTLTSADLGAKFECHLEHEALEMQQQSVHGAFVLNSSAFGSDSPVINSQLHRPAGTMMRNNQAAAEQSVAPPGGQESSFADSESASSSSSSSSELSSMVVKQASSGGGSGIKSLDSHFFVDLNVGVASLDLFMAKVNKQQQSQSQSHELREGDFVELECVAYNSKPPANITWFNGPEPIEQQPVDSISSRDSSSTSSSSEEAAAAVASSSSSSTKQQQQQKQSVLLGRHKRLLQRQQIQLNSDGLTYTTHSFLSIKLSRHEHKAQILCQAQNAPMQKPMSKSIDLQVQYAPIVLMEPAAGIVINEWTTSSSQDNNDNNNESSSDNDIATIHQRQQQQPTTNQNHQHSASSSSSSKASNQHQVSIYCIYSANPFELLLLPHNSSARWFKDGKELALPQPNYSESFTATGYPVLQISRPQRHHAGAYDCQLTNSIGTSERLLAGDSCHLEVNFKPKVQLRALSSSSSSKITSQSSSLVELDLSEELILPGHSYLLTCQVLEAQPKKIEKYYWYKTTTTTTKQQKNSLANNQRMIQLASGAVAAAAGGAAQHHQLVAITEVDQFKVGPLKANFTASGYTCVAYNSLGASEHSNRLELQLSHAPGPSLVQPVQDEAARRILVASTVSDKHAPHLSSVIDSPIANDDSSIHSSSSTSSLNTQQPFAAGSELLLECVTPNLGQPRANIWLWFKNGQPIENIAAGSLSTTNSISGYSDSSNSSAGRNNNNNNNNEEEEDGANSTNPITDPKDNNQELSTTDTEQQPAGAKGKRTRNENAANRVEQLSKIKFINAGKYLHIQTIQLNHKGNYSCVAVNRFGSGPQPQQQQQQQQNLPLTVSSLRGRDSSFQLTVALAPSFVQPLASRTYWPEYSSTTTPTSANNVELDHHATAIESSSYSATNLENSRQLELMCHVQCDPLCDVEWLRNNELLDLKEQQHQYNEEKNSLHANYVSYSVKQNILDENYDTNMFKSVESRLIIRFNDLNDDDDRQSSSNGGDKSSSSRIKKNLERRHLLDGSNYTCQSSPNAMGPPVRSTTKFIVQYPPENVLIIAPSDKLSLVEGSNGPRLRCEASAEPQPEYRWFLLKSSGSSDLLPTTTTPTNTLASSKSNNQVPKQSSSSGSFGEQETINQMGNRPFDKVNSPAPTSTTSRGTNDQAGAATSSSLAMLQLENLIELTDSASTSQHNSATSNQYHFQSVNRGGERVATSVSTLDLSSVSLERGQSGHYICEASNKLGRTRQSVYVNILYKPTCVTLHLHSLDLVLPGEQFDNIQNYQTISHAVKDGGGQEYNEYHKSSSSLSKPIKLSQREKYSLMMSETSDDFIDLRKILVLSPLLNRRHQLQQAFNTKKGTTTSNNNNMNYDDLAGSESLSFRGSIFETILNEKKEQQQDKLMHLKDKDALLESGGDEKGDNQSSNRNNLLFLLDEQNHNNSPSNMKKNKNYSTSYSDITISDDGTDSWNKFNLILLKFLNNYMKQVKSFEKQVNDNINFNSINSNNNKETANNMLRINPAPSNSRTPQATRRSSSQTDINSLNEIHQLDTGNSVIGGGMIKKNLLTFACMAQDGNPMNNLTFNWSFGNTILPEMSQLREQSSSQLQSDEEKSSSSETVDSSSTQISRPVVIYVNENRTLQVLLVRRLDTGSSLNPFQMSLLTINVVVEPIKKTIGNAERGSAHHGRASRQTTTDTPTSTSAHQGTNGNGRTSSGSGKNRYQSFYNAPGPFNQKSMHNNNNNNNNVQFGHEFETMRAYTGANENNNFYPTDHVELNERNWQEKLGTLLKCSVTNQIGTSDQCPAQVNIAERLKASLANGGEPSSEFARWRMPSLAQKSLLIISILIGCILIVFVGSALLVGPYLRNLKLREHSDELSSATSSNSKEATNTGQSSCSQKSSELGLLGNGESSLQGSSSSSDDDNSSRINHALHQHRLHQQQLQQHRTKLALALQQHNNIEGELSSFELNARSNSTSAAKAAAASKQFHFVNDGQCEKQQKVTQYEDDCSSSYDRPKSIHGLRDTQRNLHATNNRMMNLTSNGSNYQDNLYVNNQPKWAQEPNIDSLIGTNKNNNHDLPHHQQQRSSTRSRLLANLRFKSLSNKFKVDKISDLSNFTSRLENLRNLHIRNVSNSGETNTTGLSGGPFDGGELSLKLDSPTSSGGSSTTFGHSNFRRSLSRSFKPKLSNNQQLQQHRDKLKPDPYYLYNQQSTPSNAHHESLLNQSDDIAPLSARHNHQTLPAPANFKQNLTSPAYSNIGPINYHHSSSFNPMNEFIRQREVADHAQQQPQHHQPQQLIFDTNNNNFEQQSKAAAFFRSQSVRNTIAQTTETILNNNSTNAHQHQPPPPSSMYLLNNNNNNHDLSLTYSNSHQQHTSHHYGPPIFPRTSNHNHQLQQHLMSPSSASIIHQQQNNRQQHNIVNEVPPQVATRLMNHLPSTHNSNHIPPSSAVNPGLKLPFNRNERLSMPPSAYNQYPDFSPLTRTTTGQLSTIASRVSTNPATSKYMDSIESYFSQLGSNSGVQQYQQDQPPIQDLAYANPSVAMSTWANHQHRQQQHLQQQNQELYNDLSQSSSSGNQSSEHIYDTNAYATPEKTPQRKPPAKLDMNRSIQTSASNSNDERPCVSQLIQSFNSKLPE